MKEIEIRITSAAISFAECAKGMSDEEYQEFTEQVLNTLRHHMGTAKSFVEFDPTNPHGFRIIKGSKSG